MLSLKSILKIFTPEPVAPQQIIRELQWLPLPCPTHACALIPAEYGQAGKYIFECPLCMASQQVEQKPIQAPSKPAHRSIRAGGLMSTERAYKRVETKLGQRIMPSRPTRQLVPNREAIYASAPTVMDISAVLNHEH